jgi:hypothetical protein
MKTFNHYALFTSPNRNNWGYELGQGAGQYRPEDHIIIAC